MDEDIEEEEGFGLRGLIDSERGNHSASAKQKALELIEEMDVLNCVKDAIAHGETSVDIPFPEELQNIGMNDQYSGEIKWETVRENLRTLILAEKVGCEIHMKPLGLCCEKPRASNFTRNSWAKNNVREVICKSCKQNLISCKIVGYHEQFSWEKRIKVKRKALTKRQREQGIKEWDLARTYYEPGGSCCKKAEKADNWAHENPNNSDVIAYSCYNCQEYLSETPNDHALEYLTITF